MRDLSCQTASTLTIADDQDKCARIAALTRFIDWAEREAMSIGAPDCGICLQLARVALQGRAL
jgi:hypothetical protein